MSKLLWIVLIFALMAAAGAAAWWYFILGPIYRPGAARAALRNPVSVAGLHRFEEGSGPVVLVVHGGPGFAPEKPWAGAALLKDRYRFVYYHQRGCGRSVRPLSSLTGRTDQRIKQVESTLGLAAQIADIERLRQDLGAERLILAGHSFGADIATLYAAEFPERVSAMLCIAPAGLHVLPKRQGDLFSTVRKQLPPAMLAEYDAYLKEYFDFSAALQRTEKESSEFYARFAKYYGAAVKLSFAAAPGMLPGYEPLGIYLSMGQHHDYTTAYRGMRAPVLVLHGAADLQPEADSRAFAALFSNVEFARVEGATHFLYDDRPEDFARLAGGFLDRRILSRAQR